MTTTQRMTREEAKTILGSINGKYKVEHCSETWVKFNPEMGANHDAATILSKAGHGVQVPVTTTGMFKTGLTDDEQYAFETLLNLPDNTLSPYPQIDDKGRNKISYWSNVSNWNFIPKEGLSLDCDNNIQDKLKFKMLLANYSQDPNSKMPTGLVVRSKQEVRDNPSALWLISNEELETKETGAQIAIKKNAFVRFGKSTPSEIRDFFKLFKHKGTGFKVGDITRQDLAEAKIMDIIDKDPSIFLEVIDDPNFKDLVFLEDLKENNIVKVLGTRIMTHDGTTIGLSNSEAIENLHKKEFQELKITLKSSLDNRLKK